MKFLTLPWLQKYCTSKSRWKISKTFYLKPESGFSVKYYIILCDKLSSNISQKDFSHEI